MKNILHVAFSDCGGAGVAAKRLVEAQRDHGFTARMMVIKKGSSDPWVLEPLGRSGRLRVRAARFVAKRIARAAALEDPGSLRTLGLFPSGMASRIRRANPDIVHLHWLGTEMMSLAEIAGLSMPVLWTCHDMWAFCGAEHYSPTRRFIEGYASKGGLDIDRWTFHRKRRAWGGWRPVLICPSNWMAEQVAKSALLRDAHCVVIPNTLNTSVFRPRSRETARSAFDLPQDRKVILFGAFRGGRDPRKGFDLLELALNHISLLTTDRPCLVTFGSDGGGPAQVAGNENINVGVLQDPERLAMLYSAADIFVAPSRMDNLPNTLLEAQACGTPCVAFDVGGMRDVITSPIHGGLVPAFDTAALAAKILEVLDRSGNEARSQIRDDAVARFGHTGIVAQHLEIYGNRYSHPTCSSRA